MVTTTLVEELQRDGARLLEQLEQEGFPVTAAFWLRATEDGKDFLFIVSPVVDQIGWSKAYSKVSVALDRMCLPNTINFFRVKLIGENDRLAAVALKNRSPHANIATWYKGIDFGGISVECVFLYPKDITAWREGNGW